MLSTGFYSFLRPFIDLLFFMKPGVNALNGLLLISTAVYRFTFFYEAWCQCPQRASTHFYRRLRFIWRKMNMGVNALNGLLLISTRMKFSPNPRRRWCQCPQRASTYFYGSLSKALILLASES